MAWPLVLAVAALALCVVLAVVDPEDRARWSPRCPFRAVTGWDCPGCGGTRAVHALVRGDVLLAFDHNALIVLLLPLLAVGWWGWLTTAAGWRARPYVLPARPAYALAAATPVFVVARNLPIWPLSWLGSGVAG